MVTKNEIEELLDSHHERMRPNGNGTALKWLLGLLSIAVVAVVTALWTGNTRLTTVETVIDIVLPRIEKKLDDALNKP